MRRWKPLASPLLWITLVSALLVTIGALLVIIPPIGQLLQAPADWLVDSQLFVVFLAGLALLALGALLWYRVVSALTLEYGLDRNGAYIFWLDNRAIVPLGQIERIELGNAGAGRANPLQSIGYYHGRMRLPDGRTLYRFSSRPLREALILHTAGDAYAVSPQDADSFVQELEQRRRLGVIQQLAPKIEYGRFFFYAFWADRVIRISLLLTLGLNMALFGWLMSVYPQLPAEIALRANAVGETVSLAPRHQTLFLPLAAAVLALLNTGLGLTLYRRAPAGARLLQIASVVLQVCFAVAILTIVR